MLIDGVNYRIDDDTSGLVLSSAKRSQHGRYVCIAKNSEGSVSADAFVTVTGRNLFVLCLVMFIVGKNLIEIGPNNQSVVIGSNVIFSCQLSESISNINITRSWYFNVSLFLMIIFKRSISFYMHFLFEGSIISYGCKS